MSSDKIASAIDGLISHLIPNNPNDSEEEAQEQHERHFELVKSIIRKYENSPASFYRHLTVAEIPTRPYLQM